MTITYPRTQVLASSTFTVPHELLAQPTTTIPDLYEFNVKHNPNYPFFRFWDGEKNVDLTWSMMGRAFWKAARFIKDLVKLRGDEGEGAPVVAVLASSGMLCTSALACGDVRTLRSQYV